MTGIAKKILLLYLPGMDLRNLSEENTPFLHQTFQDYTWTQIQTQPSPEQLSTLITGMNPHEHGIWQMKLLQNASDLRKTHRLFEKFPDLITIVAQCLRHQFCKDCDVPTIPPHRRKVFEQHRLKFHGRNDTQALLKQLGKVPSLVSYLGVRDCRYTFTDKLADLQWALKRVGNAETALEILQFHAVDMMGHWVLDTPEKLRSVYRHADRLAAAFAEKCQARGITLLIVSDHGQEKVTSTLHLKEKITGLDLDPAEFSYYLQPITARFWFHTKRAREIITDLLKRTQGGSVLTFGDLRKFDIEFKDGAYGELYFLADPGILFFPHDFHHPLVDLVFGLKNSQQRSRLFRPWQIAYHGYLPHYESEKGWITCLDKRVKFETEEIKLIDIGPSLLGLLGREKAAFMSGRNVLRS